MKKDLKVYVFTFVALFAISFILLLTQAIDYNEEIPQTNGSNEIPQNTSTQWQEADTITAFAEQNNIPMSEYPEKLLELLEKNPETKEFVFNYPFLKNKTFDIDLSEYKNTNEVPLLMQWDKRWGYSEYSGGIMGLTGCGPTCLSMVSIHLLNDTSYTPRYVADYAAQNGYSVNGKGSAWSLIKEGGEAFGLTVKELPLVESMIINNLSDGNPIICVMGLGDFTTEGHFIVMTDYIDGKIKVNDPNSISRSEKLWDLFAIKDQIRNLWVCSR